LGFFSSSESAREQLLKITPIGTPLNVALAFAEKEARRNEAWQLPKVINKPVQQYRHIDGRVYIDLFGVKGFNLICSYKVLFGLVKYTLFAQYAFDDQDRLVDIFVTFGPGGAWYI
jgi:hypothetical protein